MEEDGAQTGVAGNASGKRQVSETEMVVDQRLRHSKVQPGTVALAVRSPRDCRVDQGRVSLSKNRDLAILAVPAQTLELGDNDAGPGVRIRIGGWIFVERYRAGSEKSHFQVGQLAAGNGAVERKFSRELEVAISADLFGIPEPGILAVRSRNMVGCKRARNLFRQWW